MMLAMNADYEEDSTCEQCGEGFDHNYTQALARFDFCSVACENAYWSPSNPASPVIEV